MKVGRAGALLVMSDNTGFRAIWLLARDGVFSK
jgi:hypothetical protein